LNKPPAIVLNGHGFNLSISALLTVQI